jgi:hypothetical protein
MEHLELVITRTYDTIANLHTQQTTIALTAKLLLTLSSTIVLGSEYHGTHDLILLSDASSRLQSPALWNKLSQSVIVFASRCSVIVPNSGNSALVLAAISHLVLNWPLTSYKKLCLGWWLHYITSAWTE